jgi:hypothetical protein
MRFEAWMPVCNTKVCLSIELDVLSFSDGVPLVQRLFASEFVRAAETPLSSLCCGDSFAPNAPLPGCSRGLCGSEDLPMRTDAVDGVRSVDRTECGPYGA